MYLRSGEDQLLVLLLVVEAELEPGERVGLERAGGERALHAIIDRIAVGVDAIERRTRQQAALGPLDPAHRPLRSSC